MSDDLGRILANRGGVDVSHDYKLRHELESFIRDAKAKAWDEALRSVGGGPSGEPIRNPYRNQPPRE